MNLRAFNREDLIGGAFMTAFMTIFVGIAFAKEGPVLVPPPATVPAVNEENHQKQWDAAEAQWVVEHNVYVQDMRLKNHCFAFTGTPSQITGNGSARTVPCDEVPTELLHKVTPTEPAE
jgi:hypothetical protein